MRSPRPTAVAVAAVPLAICTVCAVLAMRPSKASGGASAGTPPAVATVDGTPIAADEVEIRLAELLPSASYHGSVDPVRLLSLRRAALDDLVLDELIFREATASGRTASPALVDAEIAQVKTRFESGDLFAAALRENGLSERQLRERLARTVTVREARAAHARPATTDGDIETYYREHAASFQRPEQVHLLQLLVRVDPADPASAVKAERTARRLLARVERGQDFAALARAFSEDEYRVKDGDMGFVHRGRLDDAFDAAVFEAPVGRFAIARSLHGYRVFKVLERRPATQLSLEEARPIIAEGLERQQREERVRAWHTRLLSQARVEINDPALRNTRPADAPAAPLPIANRMRRAAAARSGQ